MAVVLLTLRGSELLYIGGPSVGCFLLYYMNAIVSFQLWHGVHIDLHCRLKEIPSNREEVLFPSIHSGVENDYPTNLYQMQFTPQVPPPLIVCNV